MKNGFRWSLFGGIVGIVLFIVASLIYHNFIKLLPPSQFNWSLALTVLIPIYSGVLVWAVKFYDHKNKEEVALIYKEIGKKANTTDVDAKISKIEQSIVDHKEINETQFDAIHEIMTLVDHKLDILIAEKHKR